MIKMVPQIGPPPPRTYPSKLISFAKYGFPLKNLDHLPKMKNVDAEHILGEFLRFLGTTQAHKYSNTQM